MRPLCYIFKIDSLEVKGSNCVCKWLVLKPFCLSIDEVYSAECWCIKDCNNKNLVCYARNRPRAYMICQFHFLSDSLLTLHKFHGHNYTYIQCTMLIYQRCNNESLLCLIRFGIGAHLYGLLVPQWFSTKFHRFHG